MKQCLYIIGNVYEGYIKIGITCDLHQRLRNLQTGCPFEVELLNCTKPINDARVWENAMHEMFGEWNTNGEWFRADIYDDATKMLEAIDKLN